MDFVTAELLSMLDKLGALVAVLLIALGVITERLVWHTRLKRAEERADLWEQRALDALTSARAGVKAAEVVADVISAMPDPAKETD